LWWSGAAMDPHSFPTRRSSDLAVVGIARQIGAERCRAVRRGAGGGRAERAARSGASGGAARAADRRLGAGAAGRALAGAVAQLRSEEHTSELQSRGHLVCRLLL